MGLISASENRPLRRKVGRSLAVAACLILLLGIALLAAYINRGAASPRFARLQEGMTMEEVLLVLQPQTTVDRDSNPEEGPMPARRVLYFHFTEDRMFPGFEAALTFDSGRLIKKELRGPTIQGLLQYWWIQLRR